MLRGFIQEMERENTDREGEKYREQLCGEIRSWFKMTTSSLCAASSSPPHPTLLSTGFSGYITHTATAVTGSSLRTALHYRSHILHTNAHRHNLFPFACSLKVQQYLKRESSQTYCAGCLLPTNHHFITAR